MGEPTTGWENYENGRGLFLWTPEKKPALKALRGGGGSSLAHPRSLMGGGRESNGRWAIPHKCTF